MERGRGIREYSDHEWWYSSDVDTRNDFGLQNRDVTLAPSIRDSSARPYQVRDDTTVARILTCPVSHLVLRTRHVGWQRSAFISGASRKPQELVNIQACRRNYNISFNGERLLHLGRIHDPRTVILWKLRLELIIPVLLFEFSRSRAPFQF